ncbi:hypothetical protein AMECASPLE_031745 [Ameca splendens]|uniref:Uncharacterized protein n=1 Tax=Ameca splendens TaxID=208324 RepID=A0ABV0ZS04_9TELE
MSLDFFTPNAFARLSSRGGTEGKLHSVKPSTLVIGVKVESGAFSLTGSAAASVRYVITAGKRGHIESGQWDGAELKLPTKSSDRGEAGWGTEGPFTLAASWIMLGSSRSSAPTAGSGSSRTLQDLRWLSVRSAGSLLHRGSPAGMQ